MNYQPSLAERKRRFLESCCGGMDVEQPLPDAEPEFPGETTAPSRLDRTLKKRKRRNGI